MPFVKGKSGNPGGMTRAKMFGPALERAIRKARKDGGLSALDEIAERLVNEALESENPLPAIKEIADRLDGKAVQAVESYNVEETLEERLRRIADESR